MGLTVNKILKLAAAKALPIDYVTPDVTDWRMSVCRACSYLDAENMKCGKCGCFVEVKTTCRTNWNPKKLRMEFTHCPLGKWKDKELTNQYRAIDGLEPLNDNDHVTQNSTV